MEGLKVMKAMTKMRALRDWAFSHPDQVVDEFYDKWEEDLNAQDKAWNWNDAARVIPSFREMKSMHRMWAMLGGIESQLRKSKKKETASQRGRTC